MTRFCSLPDFLSVPALCAMPVKTVRVRIPEGWNGLSWEETKAAWELGWTLWTNVVDLKLSVEKDPDVTHIAPTFARIDGSGKVLAWSEFPCPWSPPVNQRYDSSESFHTKLGPGSGVSLPLLVAHECGHALGLGHGPTGNVMAPYLDDNVVALGSWDLAEIKARYDPAVPPVPNGGDMGSFFTCLIKVLPTFLECMFSEQNEAKAAGKEGPVDFLLKLLRS
jgi:hypothetical protein